MLNKRLGQHFLRDDAVLAAMTREIAPSASETLLEIGPGDGALTRRMQAAGARLIALEIDPRFAELLQKHFAADAPRARIIRADALSADWRGLAGDGARLIGNLPYNISTPLLLKMAANAGWLADCHVMVQKEVAQRVCAAPDTAHYGRLTVTLQLAFRPQLLMTVPAAAFEPPPAVESAVMRLLPLPRRAAPPPQFEAVLAAAFGKRRKTLKNALAALPMDWAGCPIDGGRRAQSLSAAEFIALARCCRGEAAAANARTEYSV